MLAWRYGPSMDTFFFSTQQYLDLIIDSHNLFSHTHHHYNEHISMKKFYTLEVWYSL